jgi:ribonucleoside-diphosphate reductase alpha chain
MTAIRDKVEESSLSNPNPASRRNIAAALTDAGIAGQINRRTGELSSNAEVVLRRRYLSKDREGNVLEDADGMFRRVAHNLSQADKNYGASEAERQTTEDRFYHAMRRLELLPNSPTLMNAGRELQQLSACFVLPVEDSLDGIFNKVKETALIHKSGGGTGFAFSRLRPEGDVVGSTGGVASGPVSFIRAFDTATDVVKQGGTRRGANMGILDVTHPDILKFIKSKEDGQTLVNFNISVGVNADFMEKVKRGEDYDLVNPRTGRVTGQENAREVFDLLAEMAWKTGDPGLVFLDIINRDNPNPQLGRIESTNPCVTGDTWLMTAGGARQMRELVSQPLLLRVDGAHRVTGENGVFSTGIKPVLRLRTAEGYALRLTADHLVRKVDNSARYRTERHWIPAGELRPGDKIQLSDHRSNPRWDGEHTRAEGYAIGLLLGDGSLEQETAVLGVWPGRNRDGELERPGALGPMQEASAAVATLPRGRAVAEWSEVKRRGECRLNPKAVYDLAHKLGLSDGYKHLTPQIERASSEFYAGFLRGLFDADGTVGGLLEKDVSVRLAQSDIDDLEALQRMLLRLGIASSIYCDRKPSGDELLPDGKGSSARHQVKANHELCISKDNLLRFAELIGFSDTEKLARLNAMIGAYRRGPDREDFVAHVEAVEPDGYDDVFDVQVPGVNAFDANGLYVHNCGEQPLLPHESCNLASINLARMVRFEDGDVTVDWERLDETVEVAVHLLDNVIDMNEYPIPEIAEMSRKTRRIGLGVMGFADLLVQMAVPYDSKEALEIAERVMGFIQQRTHNASMELALARGSFSAWESSIYNDPNRGETRPMRNSAPTTIAPTGTISIIAGASSGIEPLFALGYVRNVMDNTRLVEGNPYFEAVARREGFYSEKLIENIAQTGTLEGLDVPQWVKDVFRTSHDITPEWHVRMQAAFQQYTDNSVSKTINFPSTATVDDVAEAYRLAYETGCKGITVYRDGSKEGQVLSTGDTGARAEGQAEASAASPPVRVMRDRPRQIQGITERVHTGHGNMYVTINFQEEGKPFEVFSTLGKAGGCDSAQLEAISRLASLALRSGVGAEDVVEQLKGITCCPFWDEGTLVRSAPDAVALALQRYIEGSAQEKEPAETKAVQLQFVPEPMYHNGNGNSNGHGAAAPTARKCPECNTPVIYQEGCLMCISCGWNKCE